MHRFTAILHSHLHSHWHTLLCPPIGSPQPPSSQRGPARNHMTNNSLLGNRTIVPSWGTGDKPISRSSPQLTGKRTRECHIEWGLALRQHPFSVLSSRLLQAHSCNPSTWVEAGPSGVQGQPLLLKALSQKTNINKRKLKRCNSFTSESVTHLLDACLACRKLWVQHSALHKPGMVMHTCNPSAPKAEVSKLNANLGYMKPCF